MFNDIKRALPPVCDDLYSVSVSVSMSVTVFKLCTGVWYTQMQPCKVPPERMAGESGGGGARGVFYQHKPGLNVG